MDKLMAYIDGLLDSGAKSFSRDVIEHIKAMIDSDKERARRTPKAADWPYTQPHWPPNKYNTDDSILSQKWIITCASTDDKPLSVCGKCGQSDQGQTGEYPCSQCGLPQTWDVVKSMDMLQALAGR